MSGKVKEYPSGPGDEAPPSSRRRACPAPSSRAVALPDESSLLDFWRMLLFSTAAAALVGNLYYIQPLLALLAKDFHQSVTDGGNGEAAARTRV